MPHARYNLINMHLNDAGRSARPNNFWRAFIVLACVALIVEALSALCLITLSPKLKFKDASNYVLTPDAAFQLQKLKAFDSELGWTTTYETPFGERPRPQKYERPLLASYGDSYTHCDEVSAAQTWQTYLSDTLEADIFNFGVGGYGTDQAYLRFRKDRPPQGTKYVSLGLILENINRTVSIYRKFYFPPTQIPLTKPSFELREGKLLLIPNPIQKSEDILKLTDPEFIRRIGANDFWFIQEPKQHYGFPYSLLLFSRSLWQKAFNSFDRVQSEIDAQPSIDLWAEPERASQFLAILDQFNREVREAGQKPIIVISPTPGDVSKASSGKPALGLGIVMKHCRQNNYRCFDGITEFLSLGQKAVSSHFAPGGHLTPVGNRYFAERLAYYLSSNPD